MTSGSELSRIDQEILRYAASRSPEEISEKFNGAIEPARVSALTKELLGRRDWLTMAEREMLLIVRLENVLTNLEAAQSANDYNNMGLQLGFLKELGHRLDKRRAATTVDLETYDMNVAREMVRAYEIALSYIKNALRSEIDEERWDEVARDALAHAGREVAKKAVE